MKIGIKKTFSDGYNRFGDKQYEVLKSHGFDCIDIGFSSTDSWLYTESEDVVIQKLTQEKALIEKAGIEVSQVHGPWRYPPRDFTHENRSERLDKMKKCARFSSAIGCRYMVIHPLMPFGLNDKNTENESKTWDINVAFMTELVIFAKTVNVIVCIENMPFKDFSLSTPSDIMRIVKYVNDDCFQACLDIGHANMFTGFSLADSVHEMGDCLKVLHVHDNNGYGDQHLPPHFGVVDWPELVHALNKVGFSGCFSFEFLPPASLCDEAFCLLSKAYARIAHDFVE